MVIKSLGKRRYYLSRFNRRVSCKSNVKYIIIHGCCCYCFCFHLNRNRLEEKCSQVRALESNARNFSIDMKELDHKLTSAEYKLQDKREECKKLRAK